MTSQIRRRQSRVRHVLTTMPWWLRDTLIGLVGGGMAVGAWSLVESLLENFADAPAATAMPAVPTAQAQVPALPAATGAPLLWKVSSGKATVYLFGSIHLLPSGSQWMDTRLFRAFDTADAAWFEVPDLDALPHFKGFNRKVMADRPVLTAGLTDAEKQQLATVLNRYNYTLADLSHVRPGVMAAAIASLDVSGSGAKLDTGVDMTLFHRAKILKHTLGGLEDAKTHYGYLQVLNDANGDGTAALKTALAAHFGTGDLDQSFGASMKAWRSGDEAAMTGQMMSDRVRNPRVYDELLVKRNRLWVPKIDALLGGDKTTFIVAGADHFLGPDGVVARLRAQGYKVERVDS